MKENFNQKLPGENGGRKVKIQKVPEDPGLSDPLFRAERKYKEGRICSTCHTNIPDGGPCPNGCDDEN